MGNNNKTALLSSWYGFKIDKERLFDFAQMSVESRLQWLEEANEFLSLFTDKKMKLRWQLFKEQKI